MNISVVLESRPEEIYFAHCLNTINQKNPETFMSRDSHFILCKFYNTPALLPSTVISISPNRSSGLRVNLLAEPSQAYKK